jgi:hypothetical protein
MEEKNPKKRDRKAELEMRKQIKEVEDKKRIEALRAAKAKPVSPNEGIPTVSFDQWWMTVNGKASLKPWMKEIIWVDFKARGLGKSETEEAYNNALKLFGIKL